MFIHGCFFIYKQILTENFDNSFKKEFKHLLNEKAGMFLVI